jgi:glutathione S-transferase
MSTLYHHPFCPHSRFVRLALGEYNALVELIEERVWERREDFLMMNPAGTTPVFVEQAGPPVPGAGIIAEYLDETRGLLLAERRLLAEDPANRVEIRRLLSWFNEKFYAEVAEPLVMERIYRRYMPRDAGGGPPETSVMRAARSNIRYHLAYITWLVSSRDWLAGDRMTYADLAAAAQLSVVDYLGEVPWNENEAVKHWYAKLKSRPSFRPLLTDSALGVPAAEHYADLDF